MPIDEVPVWEKVKTIPVAKWSQIKEAQLQDLDIDTPTERQIQLAAQRAIFSTIEVDLHQSRTEIDQLCTKRDESCKAHQVLQNQLQNALTKISLNMKVEHNQMQCS